MPDIRKLRIAYPPFFFNNEIHKTTRKKIMENQRMKATNTASMNFFRVVS